MKLNLIELGKKIETLPKKADKYYQVYFKVIGAPVLAGAATQFVFLFLYRLSPWLSILAVLFALFLVYGTFKLIMGVMKGYKDTNELKVRRELDYLILGMLFAEGILAVMALSTVSFLLLHFQLVTYDGLENSLLQKLDSFEKFPTYYWWYFIDNIPGLDCNSFHWERNLTPTNFLSKFLVFIFQVFIVYVFLNAIKQWWGNRSASSKEISKN